LNTINYKNFQSFGSFVFCGQCFFDRLMNFVIYKFYNEDVKLVLNF